MAGAPVAIAWLWLIAAPGPAPDDLVRMGRLAALAPLCGLRDEAWAFDLRRAEIQESTGTEATDDRSLKQAPGRKSAEAALGAAEADALEEFAGAAPRAACESVSTDLDLQWADDRVAMFRARREGRPSS